MVAAGIDGAPGKKQPALVSVAGKSTRPICTPQSSRLLKISPAPSRSRAQ